jgi:hypothetical protein
MNKKKWFLLFLLLAMLVLAYLLYYSTYNNKALPANADMVILFNKKKTIRTAIVQWITTPAAWKSSDWFSKKKDSQPQWFEELSIPDYPLIFHQAKQPGHVFHTVLTTSSAGKLASLLLQQGFALQQSGGNLSAYFSDSAGIFVTINKQQVLISKASQTDSLFVRQTATQLFIAQHFLPTAIQNKLQQSGKHGAAWLTLPGFKECFFTLQLEKETIKITGNGQLQANITWPKTNFQLQQNTLLQMGFTKPPLPLLQQLNANILQGLEKLLQLPMAENIPGNLSLQASWYGMATAMDAAISYRYDDNFNQVADTVINTIEEPVLQILLQGDSVLPIMDYWKQNSIVQPEAKGWLYTPFPMVKCYATAKDKQSITIQSHNFKTPQLAGATRNCIGFVHLAATQLPTSLLKYLPDAAKQGYQKIEEIDLELQPKPGEIVLTLVIKKRPTVALFF